MSKPPKLFDRILQWYCAQSEMEDIQGDFYEVYIERAASSKFKANVLFAFDTLKLFNPFSKQRKRGTWLSESYHFNFRNQLNRSFRYLKKYPFINTLKIVGLGIAISAFFYISDYANFHYNFDQFHEKKDRIYRVVTTVTSPDLQDVTAWSHAYLRDIADEFPGVEQIVRLLKVEEAVVVNTGEKHFKEREVFFSDPEFSEVFSYKWIEGNPNTALFNPNSVVLTRSIAKKYFNDTEQIVGKAIKIDQESYQVTGLVEDIPANSDLKFDLLIPFDYSFMEEWMFVYVLLHPETSGKELASDFGEIITDYNDHYTDQGISLTYSFENITEVHFSKPKLYDTPKMDKQRILLFQLVGWIILLIASVNYINLYATQLLQRIRSVNVQMVVGASKKQLLLEFCTEAFMYLSLALSLGVLMTYLTSGLVIHYTNFSFFSIPISAITIVYILISFVGAIVLSAVYALIITTRRSHSQLFEAKTIKAPFRKGLIGVQFALSFAMILGTLVIYLQTAHIQNQPLGFNPDQTINFQFPDYMEQSKIDVLKQELSKLDFVQSISQIESNSIPGMDAWVEEYYIHELEQTKLFEELGVDDQYAKTLQVEVLTGEFFNEKKHQPYQAFVVNKAFVDHLGWDPYSALDKKLNVYGHNAPIVGVVDNFYFNSPHELIKPLILNYSPRGAFAMAKLSSTIDLKSAISRMEIVWHKHLPALPFNFSFLKSDYVLQFEQEQTTLNVLGIIAGLVITLSILGMYAILLMLGKAREKELGIRKINGARQVDLFTLFSKEFVKILVIAIALSAPIVWVGLSNWLAEYPLRISLNPLYFVLTAVVVVFIACGVIYIQALKSYRSNTVDSLKYE
ncbi:ABC transporter permease [Ekhidna sp.]